MVLKTLRIQDTSDIQLGASVGITGKNGFTTTAGSIPMLVNRQRPVDESSNVELRLMNLNNLYDSNFSKHILATNDARFHGLKGFDSVGVPIKEKIDTGALLGFVGYNPEITQYSANILSYNLSTNTIKIPNMNAGTDNLLDALPEVPYIVRLAQILDPRYFSSREMYVEGTTIEDREVVVNTNRITGSYRVDMGLVPLAKKFITVYKNGIELPQSNFTWDNRSNVTLTLAVDDQQVRVTCEHYTVPTIETGDTLSFFAGNVYSVASTSYDPASPTYNAALTANHIYKVTLEDGLRANVAGTTAVNISPDIIGRVSSINNSRNTFVIDYDADAYPGEYNLGNHKLYRAAIPLDFNPITLGKDRVITNVPNGINIVRARNVNSSGRRSSFVTRSLNIENARIQQVTDLIIEEQLYLDTSQGVSIRIIISFDHIEDQGVSDYEVSYRLSGETSDLTNFNTVTLPASGVDSDGKLRFVLNNVDRGRLSSVNSITARVTPIAAPDLRGVLAEKTQEIIGKTASPQNIEGLSGGQQSENLFFSWTMPTNTDGTVVDLDLNEIEVRRIAGSISSSSFLASWVRALPFLTISTPATSAFTPITEFGTHTYLFRTKDTSGNLSDGITGVTLTTEQSDVTGLIVFKVWAEDNPSGAGLSGFTNENRGEYFYPSFANSVTGGLPVLGSTSVDRANGTSSGYTLIGGSPTDLNSARNSAYQTQIRDVGTSVKGALNVRTLSTQLLNSTWNDLKEDISTGVTDTSSSASILVDTDSGGIGNRLRDAIYYPLNGTLNSGGFTGNIYAIWNDGQFAGDGANANSFALIAGVINGNSIRLGATYFANGRPTGSNNLSNVTSVGSGAVSIRCIAVRQGISVTSTPVTATWS